MKYKNEYKQWLINLFNGDEDEVTINYYNDELYQDFLQEKFDI